MFCQKCGAEMTDDAKVCPKCGAPQGTQPAATTTIEKPKKKKIGKWIALGIVAIIIIAAIVGGSDEPTKTDSTTTSAAVADTEDPGAVAVEPSSSASQAPSLTAGQKNALRKAKAYLGTAAFSHDGLVKQLEYEGYSNDEAVYGADNCGADWNEQAAKKAKSYLDMTGFSRDGLIKQLEYEGFTQEQAAYGAQANGY